nr:LOW QUALITY PROTEIN: uncharacterized protein LOC119162261 [Rhipicephalus microplus]
MTTWLSSKTDDTSPLVIALQEVNGPVLKIMGYDGYAPTEEQDSSTKTALYVRRGTTHVQLDTQPWCSTTLSVVGCRLEVSPQRTILVFCVYVVPESTRNKANKAPVDLSFIPHFRKIYPQDVILLCGDFNSQHVAWGYNKCSPRGRRIMQDASAYGLTLLNTPQTHTRLGQTVHQADTSPDLTWSTRPQLFQWEVLDDCMGSDHFPILIRFRTGDASTKTKSRASTRLSHITHWDKYRDLLQQQPPAKNIDHLLSQLCAAKRQATKNLRVPFDHPEPDRHLLTLWNRRLRILAQYRRSRHAAHHKARLRKIQRSIETYTTTLASDRWMAICETMKGQTHTSKVWTILRSLLGQRKTYNGAARVASGRASAHRSSPNKLLKSRPFGPYNVRIPRGPINSRCTPSPKEDVLDSNSVHPRAVVAVDIRKAFDGVPHSTIMTKARALGIKGKMYNFIAGFLEGRSYQVEIGQDASTVRTNHVGVPQGSVISPTLFNIAMYQLPRRLANVPGLKHAVYADDVTVWTHQGSVGEQEDVLQRALNIIHDYAMEAGLHTAPDKTEFVVIHGGRTTFAKQEEKKCFKLHIGNQPIMRKSTIRILGMHLDENCTASTWFQRVTKTSKQILHALRRISNRTRGVNEREMRQFVQAFLVSRIMYGLPYHPVNRTQIIKLDRLLNEAKRMVTGLPRYTRLDALKSCSKLNNLTELIDMHIHTQETRLRATNAGRYTLMLLGYDINTLPMLPNKTPPWEITVLTDGKPLPLNMDPNQRARRLNYAKRHARATSSLPMTERVVYTDAALPADGTSNTCYATAWYDQTNRNQSRRYHASADAMYSTRAELVGILDYLEWALEMSPQTDPVHHRVYTDSQAAHRACANVLYTDPVLQKIRHQTRLLRECGHDVTIHWVPGHCGIPGNEKAHRLARAHLLTALARASDTPSTFLATPPELADPIADKHITKQRRAAYLTAVGNPLSIPLLPSKVFTRRESVLLRRIQAGTLLTPFLLNRFHRGDTPPPVTGLCSTCNCRADLNHLCWECPVYNPPRLRALATIKRGPWPSSLRTWACPEPSPPDRAIEFWRALIMFLQDPAAPPVGDRLRDSHKIQAIQAAPT